MRTGHPMDVGSCTVATSRAPAARWSAPRFVWSASTAATRSWRPARSPPRGRLLSGRISLLGDVAMESFEELQERLGAAWALNKPGVGVDHVLVVLPSFSVGESLLSHYADRIPALEHRYLLAALMLHRIEACEMVFLSTTPPGDEVLRYYLSLAGPYASARDRFRHFAVPDMSARSVAAKALDRPDILEEIRKTIAGRPAFIEPWNVTDDEVAVAMQLEVPIDGTDPKLWPLGYKSSGRRLFREAGVPTPAGGEGVRKVDGVVRPLQGNRAGRGAG